MTNRYSPEALLAKLHATPCPVKLYDERCPPPSPVVLVEDGGPTKADCIERFERFALGHYARRPMMVAARNGPYVTYAAYEALAREAVTVVRALMAELEAR